MEEKIYTLLNEQVNKEFQSAYVYLDFYNFFEEKSLDGFSKWYKDQANEEISHAWRFINYLHDMDQQVKLTPIEHKSQKYSSVKEVLEGGLHHEQYISGCIRDIYSQANETKDFETMNFLNYFLSEQIEEEVNARNLIAKYDFVGESGVLGMNGILQNSSDHQAQ
ncbi:ferritin [Liquorilactobacillus capillatus]|nr:ferritin [Liquorilactobacillus capillatus]